MLLEGEIALITGAAGGIGRATATALAAEGAELILADNNAAAGEEFAEALGLPHRFLACDLAAPEGAETLLRTVLEAAPRLSLFIHAASPRRLEAEHAMEVSAEAWDRMVNVNLRAGFVLGQGIGRHMRKNAIPGRMVFVTSLHAETPRNLPHYSASKAGMTMVMKELARALGPHGIRVNAIAPGAIAGGGFQADPKLAACIAMGRLGQAEDVAKMAVALLAERFAGYVTGTTIVVDGGLALHNWLPPA
ncbi:SDR family oxidoreductase [Siccirubricoccus sp. KC 17139]|uniref:SDR family oxidoreductase n=1 Tax=Siccirubricoccus soli TaxID=2899147 RepID=A0ABT1DBU3_9PROT|nr:SDR family oxidoreductase [Siccirubricoccus soli]MCO6419408.1 SDR family oxidoreductase [Siccirubricoccus soli]MCP2685543.1 SDR family oxidoreductase [Siccirubricoccus soli]